LLASPDAGVVYTRVQVHDEVKGQTYELPVYRAEGRIARELFVECRMSTSTLVVRRECLDRVGLFDEELLRAQDWDLMIRLAEEFPYAFVDEVLTLRRLHEDNISVRRSDLYAQYNLMVIEKALARRPDLYADLKATSLSRAYVRFGLEHYRRFEMLPARRQFAASLKRRWNAEAFKYWLRTFLPPAVVRRLRAWRERSVTRADAAPRKV
jgi:GT2 family glycosyltransferase